MNKTAKLAYGLDRRAKTSKKDKEGRKGDDNRPRRKGDQVTKKSLKILLHPHLAEYFGSLSDPWRVTGVRCPVNYNPVPSFVTQYARTTSVVAQHPVAANQSQTLILWPGHSNMFAADVQGAALSNVPMADLDEVAYHSNYIQMGGSTYVVGPMSSIDAAGASRVPIIGVLVNQLGVSGQVGGPLTAASSPLGYGQALPYIADVRVSGHSRWKLVSMGLVIKNTTPELNRGGALITFQPINNNTSTDVAGAIGNYMNLPSWKDHGSEGVKLTWIPRMRDLAFWHGTSALNLVGAAPMTTLPGVAGMVVNFQTPTTAQTYDIEVVCNWELAGNLFLPVGTPALHMPEAKSIVERVHTQLINSQAGAQKALSFAQSATAAVAATLGVAHRVATVVGAGLNAAGFSQ